MNHRLLSHAEKLENARGRNRRNAQRQWRRRRGALLAGLAVTAGDTAATLDLLTPNEASVLLTGHLNGARPIAARINRLGREGYVGEDVQQVDLQLPAIERPRRALREDRRGVVFPWLLPPERPTESTSSVAAGLAAARALAGHGVSPHGLLDHLACATGLPWGTAAVILHKERLIPAPFTDAQVQGIRRARLFWDRYDCARTAYTGMVKARELSDVAGDWGLIEGMAVDSIFPGIQLPHALERAAYLVNLVGSGVTLCADIHAFPSRLPLVRHPL